VAVTEVACCSNQQINALIAKKEYHPIYLRYLLRFFKSKILARTGATAVPIINKTEFESIKLPVLNNEEIVLFVRDIDLFDQTIRDLKLQITASNRLMKSLIMQVF